VWLLGEWLWGWWGLVDGVFGMGGRSRVSTADSIAVASGVVIVVRRMGVAGAGGSGLYGGVAG
jgi:hypothetical protein